MFSDSCLSIEAHQIKALITLALSIITFALNICVVGLCADYEEYVTMPVAILTVVFCDENQVPRDSKKPVKMQAYAMSWMPSEDPVNKVKSLDDRFISGAVMSVNLRYSAVGRSGFSLRHKPHNTPSPSSIDPSKIHTFWGLMQWRKQRNHINLELPENGDHGWAVYHDIFDPEDVTTQLKDGG
ncbi:hypothetical protein ARMGADRAFT_1040677 [Armillaria gallica]|uniref:Uncharacterized protein n=1 Tax=Armillaria gallica TaxID=47427 RepID=A0A2H3CMI8_ARMGA|nr:hypothetical protein ARMGADRAFT_1040677 [Armillaria gallica]